MKKSGRDRARARPGSWGRPPSAPKAISLAVLLYLSAGAAQAALCTPGNFNPTDGNDPCTPCPVGTYTSSAGQSACTLAPPGSIVSVLGATSATLCDVGYFVPFPGQSVCAPSPPGGFVSVAGATDAAPCALGSYQPLPGQSACLSALPGTFVGVIGSPIADDCPVGTFSASAGQSVCTSALPGQFVGTAGATVAQNCAVGTFQSLAGQSSCTSAPAGRYVSAVGSTVALDCAIGTFTSSVGQSACATAPAGSFVDTLAAASATACALGTYQSLTGQTSCAVATAGTFVGLTGATNAAQCPVGTFQPMAGQSSCTSAPAGRYVAAVGSTVALDCAIGTFTSSVGQSACAPAPAGSYVNVTAAASATACALGTYQSLTGQTTCAVATAGTFVGVTGATSATQCPAGTLSTSVGQSACAGAPAGQFVGTAGSTVAQPCPVGTFTSSPGQSTCTPAPLGTFVNVTGATGATSCVPGTFQSSAGATSCLSAPAGRFVSLAGQSSANLCAPGTYQAMSGATACLTASAGSFVPVAGATSATACPPGTTSGPGASQCSAVSFTLNVTRSGAGAGNVVSTPSGINCGTSCTASFDNGSSVSLAATPATGSVLSGWSGACSGSGDCQVTMDADKNVTVTFTKLTYALTVTKGGTGTGTVTSTPPGIDCGATCTASYEHGSTVTLTATPGANSTFAGWSGACSGSGSCVVTVNGIRGVTADFMVPDNTAPRIISGPLVTDITANSATVMWQTDEEATTQAAWGTGSATPAGYRTNHSVSLSGLNAETTYTVTVSSVDRANNPSATKSTSFATNSQPDNVAPLIVEGPTVTGISENRAVVGWTTNEAATSVIAGDRTASIAELETAHEVELTGLAPQTRYAITVSSVDAAGNPSATRSLAFTTLAAADTTPPAITKGPQVVGIGADAATVVWETDEATTGRVSFQGTGAAVTAADERMKTSHGLRVRGLAPGTAYAVTVSATDAFGNGPTLSAPVNITTDTRPDSNAPNVIGSIEVCEARADLLLLCFRTDEPASVQVGYGPAGGALTMIAARAELVREHRIALTGLAASTLYSYAVTLTDAAGNSTAVPMSTASTLAQAVPLEIKSGPTVAYKSNDRVVIEWETNNPATSLVEYGTTGFDRQVAEGRLVKNHSVLVTGLRAGTAYQFRIKSTDVAGNSVEAGL